MDSVFKGDSSFPMLSTQQSIEDDFLHGVTVAQSHLRIRLGFLRKVYGILALQLLFTTLVGAICVTSVTVKEIVQTRPEFLIVGLICSLVLVIALMVKRKESPTNLYLLAAFTLCEAYSVGTVVTFYDQVVVVQAIFLTAATVVGLTVYTFQSKRDLSRMGASLFSLLWILILAGIFQIFFPSEILHVGIAVLGAAVFSLFIVFDTHMLLHKLSPEEYILAAINLYLDIINLFLEVLKILDAMKKH